MKQAPNSRSQPHSLEEQFGRAHMARRGYAQFSQIYFSETKAYSIKRRDTYLFFSSQE